MGLDPTNLGAAISPNTPTSFIYNLEPSTFGRTTKKRNASIHILLDLDLPKSFLPPRCLSTWYLAPENVPAVNEFWWNGLSRTLDAFIRVDSWTGWVSGRRSILFSVLYHRSHHVCFCECYCCFCFCLLRACVHVLFILLVACIILRLRV